jgi:ATP-dependent Clp protease ATP-binding subunit ClpC
MGRHYTTYNAQVDQFVKLRKFNERMVEDLLNKVEQRINEEGFNIKHYIQFVCRSLVVNYKDLIKADSGCVESLYENVTEVYPVFQVEHVVRFINSRDEEDEIRDATIENLSQVERLRRRLKKHIIGQDEAINSVIKCIKLINSGLESYMSVFFLGPTGVGKTELCRCLAKEYLGSPSRMVKINCGEYSSQHEYSKLIGSPPGYIGHNEKGILTQKAEDSSEWVLVFDEIEKAHSKLYDLLLNLMEEGSVMDSRGTQLDFSKSLILFTSNIGMKGNVGKKTVGFGAEKTTYNEVKTKIQDEFELRFSPEFRNRIDEVVYFNQLNEEDARKIARLRLRELPLSITKKLVDYVVAESFSTEYGARNIKRYIKNNISTKIAEHILSGEKTSTFKPLFQQNKLTDVSSIG